MENTGKDTDLCLSRLNIPFHKWESSELFNGSQQISILFAQQTVRPHHSFCHFLSGLRLNKHNSFLQYNFHCNILFSSLWFCCWARYWTPSWTFPGLHSEAVVLLHDNAFWNNWITKRSIHWLVMLCFVTLALKNPLLKQQQIVCKLLKYSSERTIFSSLSNNKPRFWFR